MLCLQIVSVGKHVKGYHYIMANLVGEIVFFFFCFSSTSFFFFSCTFPQLTSSYSSFLLPPVAFLILFLFKLSSLIHIPGCNASDKKEQAWDWLTRASRGTSVYRVSLITGQLEYFSSSLPPSFVHCNRVLRTSIWSVSCMVGQT